MVVVDDPSSLVRINKYLAHLGIASRRKIDEMIESGRISLNGQRVRDLGVRIDPARDKVMVDEKAVGIDYNNSSQVYLLFNKPKGVISSVSDTHGRKTVVDAVNKQVRVYPVGRLDLDSHGLVLLTNDGDLAFKLTHPKYHIPKVYRVAILGEVSGYKQGRLANGIDLDDGRTAVCGVRQVSFVDNHTVLEITMYEGKKRQIRRMCATIHLHLLDLKRIAFGPLEIGDLKEGESRALTKAEVDALRSAVTLTSR